MLTPSVPISVTSASFSLVIVVPSNRRLPVPRISGKTISRYSSTRRPRSPGLDVRGRLRGQAGQVQEVIEDAVEGADGQREVALAWEQVGAGTGNVGGQPLAVRERDHLVLVALPDGDRRGRGGWVPGRFPAEGKAPVLDERQVIVAPAGDAGVHRGSQGGGDIIGEVPGERGLVGGDHQAAQRPGHLGPGDGAGTKHLG